MKRAFRMSIFIILFVVVGFTALFLIYRKPVDGQYQRAIVSVGGHEFRVEVADTFATQQLGLSGHAPLAPDEGMLFDFLVPAPRAFWMKDMTFPIDLLWIRSSTVVGVEENMVPEPDKSTLRLKLYPSPGFASQVLEIPAGTVARLGVKAGDEVLIK